MKSYISTNSIELPMGALIEIVSQFIEVFSPEDVSNMAVRLVQSGNELHVYTRSNKDDSIENRGFVNDDTGRYS